MTSFSGMFWKKSLGYKFADHLEKLIVKMSQSSLKVHRQIVLGWQLSSDPLTKGLTLRARSPRKLNRLS